MHFYLNPADLHLAALRDFLAMGAEVIYDSEDALVLRREGLYYGAGACDRCEEFRASLMSLCVDDAATERMVAAGLFDDVTKVWQYVYEGEQPPEEQRDFDVRVLTEEAVPFLVEHYDHPSATVKHMTERVRDGLMLGAFRGAECMGFAGLHEEGAIGMLSVLPEYRRQGVATALLYELVRRLEAAGRIPYTHVYPTNAVSMALQEGLGFVRAPHTVTWLCKHDAYTDTRL